MPMLTTVGAGPCAVSAGYIGPFDGITFAALYGLKRYLTSYTGSLIRLRRNSDNAESDFGYVEATGLLDTAAITTWLGGANGYIATWYDQSGNGRNATQATAGYQPTYVASGQNGLPVLTWAAATTHALAASFGATLSQPNTVIVATERTGGNYIFDGGASGGRNTLFMNGASNYHMFSDFVVNSGVTPSGFDILVARYDGASSFLVQNGSQGSNVNSGTNSIAGVTLGARFTVAESFVGKLAAYGVVNGSQNPDTLGVPLADLYGVTWS